MSFPDRTLNSRYELKFWLSPERVVQVRRSIRPFVQPDRHAAREPGYRYAISSLYLDNPSLDCYRTTIEGHRNRFKLRIRTYSDDPASPVFCEIKRRSDMIVRKSRARVSRQVAQALLEGKPLPESPSSVLADFAQLTRRLGAAPMMRVRYMREAWESVSRDPVRVTFDTELENSPTFAPDLSMHGSGWSETPTEGAILEVKFTDNCPSWVTSMIRSLSLERTSVPKYILCIDEAKDRGRLPKSLRAARA